MRKTWARVARAVAMLVAVVVAFVLIVPKSQLQRSRMGGLVIAHSALSEVPQRASVSQAVPASRSTFAAIRNAARQNPDDTGIYGREWAHNSQGEPEAGVVLQLLPDDQHAVTALTQVVKQLNTSPSLQGATATSPESFSVPGLPGARGVSFLVQPSGPSSTSPPGTAYVTAFRQGLAIVNELTVTTSKVRDTAPAIADAKAGAALLASRLPGFTMVTTSIPFVPTLVFVLVALVLVAAAVVVPEWLVDAHHRRRQRREARELKKEREQYMARGRRTVRRQRAPAWSQGRRR